MGHSMGGYGTNNVATRHPHTFAAMAPVEGTDSVDLIGNLRHVPWFAIGAVEDLDANAEQARAMYGALSDAGFDASLLVYDLKIHEYSTIYDTLPRLFDFFARHRRPFNPATVWWTRPLVAGDRPDLGLVYDGAYWLRGVRAADDKALGSVTVESLAIPHRRRDPAKAARTSEAREDPGPSGRTRGTLFTTAPDAGVPAPRGNVLRVDAANVAAATVDLRRARLRVTRRRPLVDPFDVEARADAHLAAHTSGSRARAYRSRRHYSPRPRAHGRARRADPAGTHTIGLRRV